MNQKMLKILSGVFVIQLALMAFFYLDSGKEGVKIPNEPILSFNLDKVSKVVISENKEKSLTLAKKDGHFVLTQLEDFPVNHKVFQEKFKELLGFKKSWPAGKTKIAAKKFKVTEEEFERKVDVFEGDKKQTFYIGSSPSFKKVHLRSESQDETYAVDFNAFDLPLKPNRWANKEVLKQDINKISRIDLGGLVLNSKDGNLTVNDLKDTEEMNVSEVSSIRSFVLKPGFDEVMTKTRPTGILQAPWFSFSGKGEKDFSFEFFEHETTGVKEKDDKTKNFVVMKSTLSPYFFKVRKTSIEKLKELNRAKLVKEKEDEAKVEDDAKSEGGEQKKEEGSHQHPSDKSESADANTKELEKIAKSEN